MKSTGLVETCGLIIGLFLAAMMTVNAANLTISIRYDDRPEQTQWTFKDKDTGVELFRQGFNTWNLSRNPRVQTETFPDLGAGTYRFIIKDSASNGICCANGNGWIKMSQNNDILYERAGDFTDALYVDVQVNVRGQMSISEVDPPSPPISTVNPKSDWPGFFPNDMDHAFSLNVKLDTDPAHITMEILKQDTVYFNKGWLNVYSNTPAASRANNLFTKTFSDMEPGVYFLRINNTASNGLGPNGWATLTNNTNVFWQVAGDSFTASKGQAFMILGFYGTTVLTSGQSP